MQNFTNDIIDVDALPKFEQVSLVSLHRDYWKVILISILITMVIVAAGIVALSFFSESFSVIMYEVLSAAAGFFILVAIFSRISFLRKGYAFREHDVLFRSGIISTTTLVIPYNRVQHVALHEGLVSRYFNLAEVRVFTAGGGSSDLQIAGIPKEQAESIKQLLTAKIQKQL